MTEPTYRQPQYGGGDPYAQQQPPQNAYGQDPYSQNPYGQNQYGQNPYGNGGYTQPQPPPNPYGTGPTPDYGPAPRRKRKPILLYVRLGVLVVVLIAGGVSWLITNSHKANRDAGGTISKAGTLDAISLRAGDCYEKPADPTVAFSSIKAIPCTQAHDAQAFFSFTYPGATAIPPTDDDMKTNAQPQCENAAKTMVDQSKVPDGGNDANLILIYADDSTWAQGHHDILCTLENDTDYTGSILK